VAHPIYGFTIWRWRILLCCRRCKETTELCFRNMEAVHARMNVYKAQCYDNIVSRRQQTKGMQRMARKIKRLEAKLKSYREAK
jgi:hypothetical protein